MAFFKFTFYYWGRVHVRLNRETLHSYSAYILNLVPISACLQSKKIAMELNITSFQTEKEKQWSYLRSPKQIINANPTATREQLRRPVQPMM